MSKETIDKADFEQIFRTSYTRMYYFAYQFVNDDEAVRDIVSESFMAAWKNRSHIEKSRIVSYIYTCVKHKCITYTRKKQTVLSIDDLQSATLLPEGNEEKWREKEARYNEIEQEISRMSERTRLVLNECYLKGHTYKEVAEMLHITTDGVKKHITRALAQLRAHFNIDKRNH